MLTDLVKLNNDEIVPIVKNLAFLKGTVEATVVIDEESEKLANDLRMKINSLVKGAEARRKEITDPINAEAKKVKKMFDDVVSPFSGLLDQLDRKIIPYTREKQQRQLDEAKRKQAEEIAEKERQAKALEDKAAEELSAGAPSMIDNDTGIVVMSSETADTLNKMAETVKQEIEVLQDTKLEVKKTVQGDESSTTVSFTLKAKITAPNRVERQFCEPSMKLINEYIRTHKVRILARATEKPGDNPAEVSIQSEIQLSGIEFYKDFGITSRRI
jgi:hypothetical protein